MDGFGRRSLARLATVSEIGARIRTADSCLLGVSPPQMQEGENVPAVSVVAPCYDEAGGLKEFYRRVTAACRSTVGDNYELIMVDDGSQDDTWKEIESLASLDNQVVGLRLMRNFGHQLALTAGLAASRGRRVMLIDADLQDPPELLVRMMELMDGGADVVYGQRLSRRGESWFKLATAAAFYRTLSSLTNVPIPSDTGDFRLMSRRVVDILMAMPERERFIRGMVSWIGGRQIPLIYDRASRSEGKTKYSLPKMMDLAADAVTGFSVVPLHLAFWLALLVAAVAILLVAYALSTWLMGNTIPGWTSTTLLICFFASAQLLVLGIIGEYVGRLMKETKARPAYLVDAMIAGGRSFSVPIEFSRLSQSDYQIALRRQQNEVSGRGSASELTNAALEDQN
jgi:polyisoprenyl-phosphate glycosyltransferase